jgi:nucleoside-diphosphate-sugar epimerase
MAPLPPSPETIILISGINGYIASHIALHLLQQGYTVRGTSRSASAKDRLVTGPFKDYATTYQHAVVKDIAAPGAFDSAVQGVSSIIHTASPIDFSLKTLEDFVGPAVQGNTSILASALQHAGPQLQSFVLTSSVAAVVDRWAHPFTEPYAYSESDWNINGPKIASSEPFNVGIAYSASKTLAERALWEFVEKEKPGFSCAAVHPGVVIGPPILFPDKPEGINLTVKPIWDIYTNAPYLNGKLPPPVGGASWIDVRDVAEIHAWAALHPDESNGQRYLATNGKAPPQAIADLLREEFPDRDIITEQPGYWYQSKDEEDKEKRGGLFGKKWGWELGGQSVDAAKMRKALGGGKEKELRGYKEAVLDTVAALEGHFGGGKVNGTS